MEEAKQTVNPTNNKKELPLMGEARIGAMNEEPPHGSSLLSGDTDSNGGGRWDRAKRLREQLSSSRLGFSVWCGLVFLVHSSCPVLTLSNEGNTHIYRTLPRVFNCTKGDVLDSAGTKGCNFTDGILLQSNASTDPSSSTSHGELTNSRLSCQTTYTLEAILRNVEGYCPLTCEKKLKLPKEQEQFHQSKEILNSRAHHLHTYLNLDEFRSTRSQEKGLGIPTWPINITHRLDTDGTEYNYTSTLKGAKVVAHNKEAKGVSNILGKDHDKYLRNPCSVGGKFVVIELAEETLVDAVRIANFEHHSSNFKEFELSGSLSYPTEVWTPLGNFVAENVKHIQSFKLPEPKWLRYLKLHLLSHHGSEFYCTLSVLEVYGIDVIERMLEDLFVASPPKPNSSTLPSQGPEGVFAEGVGESNEKGAKTSPELLESVDDKKFVDGKIPDPVMGVRQQSNGRVPADTVLKILMQKIRLLELNLSVLEEYFKEVNQRQGEVLPGLDSEMSRMSTLLEEGKTEIRDIMKWEETMEKGISNLMEWKSFVLSQAEALDRENSMLRLKIEKVARVQMSLETKETMVLAVSLFFFCYALFKLVSSRSSVVPEASHSDSVVVQSSRGWFLILFSSIMTLCITVFYS